MGVIKQKKPLHVEPDYSSCSGFVIICMHELEVISTFEFACPGLIVKGPKDKADHIKKFKSHDSL